MHHEHESLIENGKEQNKQIVFTVGANYRGSFKKKRDQGYL